MEVPHLMTKGSWCKFLCGVTSHGHNNIRTTQCSMFDARQHDPCLAPNLPITTSSFTNFTCHRKSVDVEQTCQPTREDSSGATGRVPSTSKTGPHVTATLNAFENPATICSPSTKTQQIRPQSRLLTPSSYQHITMIIIKPLQLPLNHCDYHLNYCDYH